MMISNALRQEDCLAIQLQPGQHLSFRRIQLFDKLWMEPLLKAENSLASTGCFGTAYLWEEAYGQQIARVGSRLILQYTQQGEITFAYPQGKGDIRTAVLVMRQIALDKGIPFKLVGLTDVQRETLQQVFPHRFSFTEDRDSADYVYEAEALATLSGNKFHGKKNHCNRFMKSYPDWRFEPLRKEHASVCMELLNQWEAARDEVVTGEQRVEPRAVARAFAAYNEMDMDGGILFVGDQPVAFTLGEKVGQDGFDVHFEKADTSYEGAYTMINREFVRSLLDTYPELKYINREEDMGVPNLRKAKLSYKPAFMLMKYTAAWEE